MPVAAAAIGGAASIGGALIGDHATSKASKAQVAAANAANALQQQFYDQTRADQAPWREAGAAALGQLQEFLKPGADLSALLQAQPGYQARLNEGVNALDRSASANGSLNSGGQQKALTRYGQMFGSNELSNVLNRYASMAGLGQTANSQIQMAGQNQANQSGANLLDAGAARASGYLAQGQLFGNALGQVGGILGGYLNPRPYGQAGGYASSPVLGGNGPQQVNAPPPVGYDQGYPSLPVVSSGSSTPWAPTFNFSGF